MTEQQAELDYLRYVLASLECEEKEDKLYFINSQYRALGNYIPKQYDIYIKD